MNMHIYMRAQVVLLLQSMLQALMLLMLMRNCLVLWGWWPGLLVLALMWLPTELMTVLVTPHVLAQLSLAYAVGVKNKQVDTRAAIRSQRAYSILSGRLD